MIRVAVARNAMATRFEIVLFGKDATSLRAVGEEALNEIERLEAQLSLYRPSSEIANINARAAREPVRVEPSLFRLLQHAKQLSDETKGAFDITIAPLMSAWGLMRQVGRGVPAAPRVPSRAELAKARACVGMHLVELDPKNFTVRFARPGVMLDLGAIGKGYAIDQAADILREAGVPRALVHGGTSTAYAIGGPWKIAISAEGSATRPLQPQDKIQNPKSKIPNPDPHGVPASAGSDDLIAIVDLQDTALSVSAVWGKSFRVGRKTYGHIIDPRTARPVQRAVLAAVILPSATETDALSTALLTVGIRGYTNIMRLRRSMRSLLVDRQYQVVAQGFSRADAATASGSLRSGAKRCGY
jgi:FAD:protein FMN transferase